MTIADSLTGRNLDEAVLVHQSGLRLLLAPQQGEQGEDITGEIARQVMAGAKRHYDLVIADCGSVVTEASAVGMEFADDIALVTDGRRAVAARGYDKIEMLSRLQIAKNNDVRLLFNKVSSRNEVQPEFGRRITGADSFKVALPEDWKRLEPVANSLAPLDLEDGPFRRSVIALGRELRLTIGEGRGSTPAPGRRRRDRGAARTEARRRRGRDDAGQVTDRGHRRSRGRHGDLPGAACRPRCSPSAPSPRAGPPTPRRWRAAAGATSPLPGRPPTTPRRRCSTCSVRTNNGREYEARLGRPRAAAVPGAGHHGDRIGNGLGGATCPERSAGVTHVARPPSR